MNKETKKRLIPTLIAVVLMFVWIFAAVMLTGGREISAFTETDMAVFSGFIFVEILTLVFIVIVNSTGRKTEPRNRNQTENVKKPADRRRTILNAVAFAAAVIASFGGIFARNAFAGVPERVTGLLFLVPFLLPVIFLLFNLAAVRIYRKMLQKRSVAENQTYWISHRDNPEKTMAQKLALLKRLVRFSDLYAVVLAVCAVTAAFFSGVVVRPGSSVAPLFVCCLVLSGAVFRIRLKMPGDFFNENNAYVSESDYPALYALARKAAAAVGCKAEIKIAVLDDFNAGAANLDGKVSIQLGALLLRVLSEEEVYCVLLHEFSHIQAGYGSDIVSRHYRYLCDVYNNGTAAFWSGLTKHLFTFTDFYFNIQYDLYLYTASLVWEREADRAMAVYGRHETAASALLKIHYYELYDWEKGTYDAPCMMESETFDTGLIEKEAQSFQGAMRRNAEKWNAIIQNEILSRSATHPTTKMRLESLGVGAPRVLPGESSAEYLADCEKAVAFVSALTAERQKDRYAEIRRYMYLDSLELVEKWERRGKLIIAEEYRDVCAALRNLGRNTEALALCEDAILLLDDAAASYANYMKGCFLLHALDESGLEYIYKAIESNSNYIEEGLETIGSFCCLTGQEDQLEIYRERAIALTERNEVYAETGILRRKDRLSAEILPEGMLEDILRHIIAEHSDRIENIYLVRKTITDDFFASVFVIRFLPDTDDDVRDTVLHRAFNYLDTCSDWQFSLFDFDEVENVRVETIPGSCVYPQA